MGTPYGPYITLGGKKVLVTQSSLTLCDLMDCKPTRLLCPCSSLGKNTEVSCHSFFQGIFLIEPSSPALQADSLLSELPVYTGCRTWHPWDKPTMELPVNPIDRDRWGHVTNCLIGGMKKLMVKFTYVNLWWIINYKKWKGSNKDKMKILQSSERD